MFSETRYALNGDLRVAYRASREGPRDIVFVPNWFTCCEHLPELPSIRGWVEAMTSLGRLIFFDQPGTGASDPVTPGALPTLEQWADSITAVLDDLGALKLSSLRSAARSRPLRCSRRHICPAPPRWSCSAVTQMRAASHPFRRIPSCDGPNVGQREDPTSDKSGHAVERGDPGSVGPNGTPGANPRMLALVIPLVTEADVRAVLPTVRVPTLVVHHADDPIIPPARGKYIADRIPGAKYVELPGRNLYHFVEPWRASFQEIAEFLTGHQAEVADDRVLATVLFT